MVLPGLLEGLLGLLLSGFTWNDWQQSRLY